MANITWLGASYSGVPWVTLPKTGGGAARFDDCTDTTAAASDVASGKKFHAADGTLTTGTNSGGGVTVQTKTGTFTGNGTRQINISCDFEPDLVFWDSNPGTSASSGTCSGIIVRDMVAANRYRNNSTSNTWYGFAPAVGMNTTGSSYCHRATYDSSTNTVTIYCYSSNARSLFTNNRTYTYTFMKWTS